MMKFVLPIILIGISITLFFGFANPTYKNITQLRAQVASYDEALSNSKALENARDVLTAKKNSMDPVDIAKLEQLLPDSIDNIRLILEIEKMASPYSMVLKNVKYNATATDAKKDSTTSPTDTIQGGGINTNSTPKDYGVWDLEFSTTGTYNDFLSFIGDLERNLRIVDISTIQFSANNVAPSLKGASPNTLSPEIYTYNFKIKTYWLKD